MANGFIAEVVENEGYEVQHSFLAVPNLISTLRYTCITQFKVGSSLA